MNLGRKSLFFVYITAGRMSGRLSTTASSLTVTPIVIAAAGTGTAGRVRTRRASLGKSCLGNISAGNRRTLFSFGNQKATDALAAGSKRCLPASGLRLASHNILKKILSRTAITGNEVHTVASFLFFIARLR